MSHKDDLVFGGCIEKLPIRVERSVTVTEVIYIIYMVSLLLSSKTGRTFQQIRFKTNEDVHQLHQFFGFVIQILKYFSEISFYDIKSIYNLNWTVLDTIVSLFDL